MHLPEAEDRARFIERCDQISRQYQFEHALKQTLVFAVPSAGHQIVFINRIKRGVASHLTAFTGDAKEHDVMGKFNRYEVGQQPRPAPVFHCAGSPLRSGETPKRSP